MAYRVDLTERAAQDLRQIYRSIKAEHSGQARVWFNGLERAVLTLEDHPSRGTTIPEDTNLRHLLYGRKPHVYRIIYEVDERNGRVSVLHIRYGARDAFTT